MREDGCPEGMYPLDSSKPNYFNYFDTFAELRAEAEAESDLLNLPLSWYFNEDEGERSFTLMVLMPRKTAVWALRTSDFNRAEVQMWLDTWLRGEIDNWFGWQSARVLQEQAYDAGFTDAENQHDGLAGSSGWTNHNPYREEGETP